VAYLARIDGSTQVFHALSGDTRSFGFAEGDAVDLAGTYCQRMIEHRIPNAVPCVAEHDELSALPITTQAQIGAYIGVPVRLPNGHIYGTLCAVSHTPAPGLAEVDLTVMQSFAGLIANHLEHDVLDAATQRQTAEVTGISALLSALTARDHYTGEHSETVVQLASAVARRLGLGAAQIREVEQVALLHDIGKVGIPDSILQKRAALSDDEWEVMHQHPTIGARIIAGVPMFAHLAAAVNAEHERFDGTGYPDELRGTAIPLASRITFACDAYHAMTSDRPYRRALSRDAARDELRHGAGTQFDPEVVDALTAVLDGETRPLQNPNIDDVLSASMPRQTPMWKPETIGPYPTLGHARAECIRCGTQTPIIVGRATAGGRCINCGSHELRPLTEQPASEHVPTNSDAG
jgi:HD-GYP domain-containing protein (c-di-GMP phosphodiesterase class II)